MSAGHGRNPGAYADFRFLAGRKTMNLKTAMLGAFVVGVCIVAGLARAQGPAQPLPSPPLGITLDFPVPVEGYRGSSVQLDCSVINESKETIRILSIVPRKGEGAGSANPDVLEPGARGRIRLQYNLPETLGSDQVNFVVKTDDPQTPSQAIRVPYFVQSAYEPEFAVLDFGDMHAGQRLQTRLTLSSRHVRDFEFKRIVAKPDWLDVRFSKTDSGTSQQVDVVATTTRMPGYGLITAEVVLESNVREDRQLRLPVVLRGFSKYRISPFPVSLGGVPEGLDSTKTLRIHRIDGDEVRLKDIDPGSAALKVDRVACGTGCMDLLVHFDSMRARRGMRTVLKLMFEDDDIALEVPIDALVVPVGIKNVDLGDLDEITVRSTTTVLE